MMTMIGPVILFVFLFTLSTIIKIVLSTSILALITNYYLLHLYSFFKFCSINCFGHRNKIFRFPSPSLVKEGPSVWQT